MANDYPWMIYGVTGLSGGLIAREAVAQGLRPILAGRNAKAVEKIACELGLSWRAFEMSDYQCLEREISSVNLLVNAAGPFQRQAPVLIAEACLATHTHYFDLNNQIPSLVGMYMLNEGAKEKSLTLLPGLALSPAVSNCLVQYMYTLLPEADCVDIVVVPFMRAKSQGTNFTLEENLQGGFRRYQGVLGRCSMENGFSLEGFPMGNRRLAPGALGDVEAAYYSTKLPNITAYIITDLPSRNGGPHQFSPVSPEQTPIKDSSGNQLKEDGNSRQSLVWVRISKQGERYMEGWLQFGEGYEFNASVVVAGVSRLLKDEQFSSGAHTVATALGHGFILDLPNVKWVVLPIKRNTDSWRDIT